MQKKDTRDRILETALLMISEKGYLGTTTRELAFRADVTEITLFRHFGSKENLFQNVLNRYTFLPVLKELMPEVEEMQIRDALCRIGETFLKSLQQRRQLVRIMLSEVNIYPEKVRNIHRNMVDGIIGTLSQFIAKRQKVGEVGSISPEIFARGFLGMIFSFFQKEEILYDRVINTRRARKTIRELVDIVTNGICVREEGAMP